MKKNKNAEVGLGCSQSKKDTARHDDEAIIQADETRYTFRNVSN